MKSSKFPSSSLLSNDACMLGSLGVIPGVVALKGVGCIGTDFVLGSETAVWGNLERFWYAEFKGDVRYVHGESLHAVCAQIAHAMMMIHSKDVVHRDLKAENVLVFDGVEEVMGNAATTKGLAVIAQAIHVKDVVCREAEIVVVGNGNRVVEGKPASPKNWKSFRVKIADFDRSVHLPPKTQLTEPVGSLFHMAPELLAWEPYDKKVDVYAFGILMYEIAHGGASPYTNVGLGMPDAITRQDFAKKVVEEDFRPNWQYDDLGLKRLAQRCWAKNPNDRPDFEEVYEALKRDSPWSPAVVRTAPPATEPPTPTIPGVGTSNHIGKIRERMEDATCVLKTTDHLIACVFDGLRDAKTAEYAARRFAMALSETLETNEASAANDPKNQSPDVTKLAIQSAFRTVDSELKAIEPPIACGSTAVAALLRENDLVVTWLGDSLAYLFRKTNVANEFSALPLVDKHHPDRDDETSRIVANEGVVGREQIWMDNGQAVPSGPWRVFVPKRSENLGISLSRAFGLFDFKPCIGEEPEMVQVQRRPDEDLFLVLGSDGVFDLLDVKQVFEIVVKAKTVQEAADTIIRSVLDAGAHDNASVIVVNMKANDLVFARGGNARGGEGNARGGEGNARGGEGSAQSK